MGGGGGGGGWAILAAPTSFPASPRLRCSVTTCAPPIGCDFVNNWNNGDLVLLLSSEDAVSNIIKQPKHGGKSPYMLPLLKFCQRALNAYIYNCQSQCCNVNKYCESCYFIKTVLDRERTSYTFEANKFL